MDGTTSFSKKSVPFIVMGSKIFEISGHSPFIMNIYNKLDEKTKNTFYGKLLGKVARLSVGERFPEFTLPTPENKLLTLKEVVKKSKVTLVHFWATNSYKRDDYQNELQMYYKKSITTKA